MLLEPAVVTEQIAVAARANRQAVLIEAELAKFFEDHSDVTVQVRQGGSIGRNDSLFVTLGGSPENQGICHRSCGSTRGSLKLAGSKPSRSSSGRSNGE
ncbi:MAG: hypothetical protein NZ554_06715 [Bryobacteraceae bacterium]|nr:hypothetical protein [Bryobacteraceae bacterium]